MYTKKKGNLFTNEQKCCFFGHREIFSDIIFILKEEIEKLIIKNNVTEFFIGSYGNFDNYAVNAVNCLKNKYSYIKLIYVTPYLYKLESDKNYINHICDETIYPEGLEVIPQKFAITHRNRWVVEHSDFMIVYVNHSYGGAYTAMKYGKNKGIKIINIADVKIK